MEKFISEIKTELNILASKSNEELEIIIEKLKRRGKEESLDNIISPWFAMVQEISYRKIGLKHFDTQLLAGLILHKGKIVEMKTGEGKTLSSTLPVSLNALAGQGTHVVTVNEYLAERDQKWMGKVYNGLNLSVGLIKSEHNLIEKRKNYAKDITYVTNSDIVFDFLRDNLASEIRGVVQRPFYYCLIDEIDSILIDEARTPLIISKPVNSTNYKKLVTAKRIADKLEKIKDFEIDEKTRDINLTEKGYEKVQSLIGRKTLFDSSEPWILEILNALKSLYIFKINKDYIILNNKIVIVDENTGRIMEDRRWSLGIHEAIEIKEQVKVGEGTTTQSSITYQNFFNLFPKLGGMTGTAKTAEKEFQDIYNLDVIVVPTSKPLIRKDLPDLIFQNEISKWKAVLTQTKECVKKGQPLLIGTSNVEKSEFLSNLFTLEGIKHQLLNAKPENVRRESEIVAQAGERSAVTIATNMAGRGTDIILGGNPYFKVKEKLTEYLLEEKKESNSLYTDLIEQVFREYENQTSKEFLKKDVQNLPYSFDNCSQALRRLYKILYDNINEEWEIENKKIKEFGGLFVLGTTRHETRRIDNQLRGRSGRQGDPGISQFFLSLDDEIIKIFGGNNLKAWVDSLIDDKDTPLVSDLLTKSLENAQKKIESLNYESRKNVFKYDDVLNKHRKTIFKMRKELLMENVFNELSLRFTESQADILTEIDLDALENLCGIYSTQNNWKIQKKIEKKDLYKEIWISSDLRTAEGNFYVKNCSEILFSEGFLDFFDSLWTEHLERMSFIRETINWRSYGQQNPLTEYNIQASDSFDVLLTEIRSYMLYYFLSAPLY